MQYPKIIGLRFAAILLATTGAVAAPPVDTPRIVAPRAQEVIHSNAGVVPVVVVGVPPDAELQPVLDGATTPLQKQPAFELHSVVRGNHKLRVRLLDAHHRVLAQTPTVVFHVWHASRE